MRRFIAHALLFILVQVAIVVLVWRACPDDPDHYMAATLDKHERLRTAPQPRLIFVGGSNVAFSIDSREFASLDLAPVNMGLNDGLGLPWMLAEVASELGPDDVVVVMPETALFWAGSQHDAIWAVLQRRPASLACLWAAGPRSLADVSDQGLHFFARKLRCAADQVTTDRELPNIYRRSSFDEFGDFVAHRDQPAKVEEVLGAPWPMPDPVALARSIATLERFAGDCRRARARCFLAWAPTREAQFAGSAALFELLEARLRAEVSLPMLEGADEQVFPDAAFFDRGPHLTGVAAQQRSRRLATRLTEALAGSIGD